MMTNAFRRLLVCILLIFFVTISSFTPCFAAQPQRVAILPIFFDSNKNDEIKLVIEKALADKFHTALASIVPVYDILSQQEVAAALPAASTDGKQKTKLDKGALANMAEKLHADTVIAAEVTRFFTYTYYTWDGELRRQTILEIRLLSYHNPSGEFIDKKENEYYNGDDILWGQPDYIAKQLMATLLAKVPDYR